MDRMSVSLCSHYPENHIVIEPDYPMEQYYIVHRQKLVVKCEIYRYKIKSDNIVKYEFKPLFVDLTRHFQHANLPVNLL